MARNQNSQSTRTSRNPERESETCYRSLFDNNLDAVFLTVPDGKITAANPAACAMFGMTEEELCRMGRQGITDPDDMRLVSTVAERLRTGRFRGELSFIRKDGTKFVCEVNSVIVPGEESKAFVILRDISARKLGAEGLRQSEERYRLLFDRTPDGIFAVDRAGRVVLANPACESISGYRIPELLQKTFMDLCAPDQLARTVALFERRGLIEQVRLEMETALIRKDGRRVELWVAGEPIISNGKVVEVHCTVKDITERKRIEEALRRRAEEVERLLEIVPAAVWVANDPQCAGITGNRRANEFYEASPGENVSATTLPEARRFFGPDGRDLTSGELPMQKAAATNRDLRDVEVHVLLASGRRMAMLGSAVPLRNELGEVRGCIGAFLDITERNRAEAALQGQRQLLENIVNHLPAAVLLTEGNELRIRLVNPAFQAFAPAREMVGKTVEEVWPEIRPEQLAQARRVLATGEPCSGVDQPFVIQRRDGVLEQRYFTWSLFRVPFPGEEHWGILNVAWETTSRKQAEAARQALVEERGRLLESERSARSEAERANRLKDEFLANLSHELRTPLNAILGWAHILRKRNAEAETLAKGLEVIERNAHVLVQLISDLLDVSRIVAGKMRLETEYCNPVAALESAVEFLAPAAEAKRIRIERKFEALPGLIWGDPARLQQAFWNLLSNAVKFTPPGGRVQISLERIDSHARVVFRDTGKGIDPDFLPHIFERFRQADSSTARTNGGLGLGLAIVKDVVELHGGTIRAESPGVGRGATFTVVLPTIAAGLEQEPGCGRMSAGPAPVEIELHGLKVLFVDDEPDTREMTKRLLEERGAVVEVAGSAGSAIASLQEFRPDVLIGDIGMPGMDGYAMLLKIRELPPEAGGQIPAIALTAYSRPEDRTRALLAGYQYHLAKPVEPTELIAILGMIARRLPKSAGRQRDGVE